MEANEGGDALKAIGWTVVFLVGTLLSGVVVVDLWCWFAVPLGAPEIGLFHALGLRLLVFPRSAVVESGEKPGKIIAVGIVFSLVTWGLGWLYASLMGVVA